MTPNEEIQAKLGEVRDRIRKVQLTRGTLVTATIALAGLLLMMAADWLFAPLPGAARWALFIVWIASIIYAGRVGFAPYFRKIGLVQIARWIEMRHPEIQERMSTVLEISKQEGNIASTDLIDALGLAAHRDIEGVNPDVEIKSAATKKKWARPALALAAVLALVLVIWPSQSGRLLVRALVPFSNLGNAGAASFELEPGDTEVLEGDPVSIIIEYAGTEKTIDLWIEHEGKDPFPQTLTRAGKTFNYKLDPALQSFRYYAQSGRSQSDAFDVKVWPLPEMLDPRLTLDYKEYTGLSQRTVPLGNGLEAVEGTKVTLLSPTNTPLTGAWLEVDGVRLSDGKLETSATGGRVSFSWVLARENSGVAVITAKHPLGRELELARFPIEVLPDSDPQVLVSSPSQDEIRVRFDQRVPLNYDVTEDFSLAKVEIEVDAGGDRQLSIPQDLPLRRGGSAQPAVFDGTASIAVGKIRETFSGVNEARVRIVATDNRPADLSEGPGVGTSRWLTLKFDQGAESLARQGLREEHEGAREKIEDAIRKAREAKDELASLREEVKKEALPDGAQEKFEKANAKLADTQEKVEKLTNQMDDSIHASKSEKVEQAAEKLDAALAKAESSPLQDTPEKRQQALEEAVKTTDEAIAKLEEVRNEINEDQQRVEDLGRFQELAQKQEELARQAEKNLNMPMAEEQIAEWKRQQEEMKKQLAEQLKQRPDALAEALAQQAKQAEQLAQKAEELAENQSQLQQQAEQQAAAEPVSQEALAEALKQALAEEQQSIANEAQAQLDQALQNQSEIADTLPEATSAANEALAQLQNNEPAAASESAEQAAQAMQEAAQLPATPASAQQAALEAAAAQENSAKAAEAAAAAEQAAADSGTPEAAQAAAQAADTAEAAAQQAAEASAAAEQAAAQAGEPSAAQAASEAAAKAEAAAQTAAEAASAAEQAASGEPAAAKAAAEAAASAETAAAQAAQAAAQAAQASAEATAAQAAEMAASGQAPATPSASPAQQAQSEALSSLSERQENVAQAMSALAEGNLAEALQAVQSMQSEAAAQLAENLASLPQIDPSGAMQQAAQSSAQAAQSAESAAQQAAQGQQAAAAPQHAQASQQLAQTSQQLAQAAQSLSQAAAAAAAQAANAQQAPVSASDLAAAAQQAAQAAASEQAAAAQAAAQAAQSMAQAAQAARSQMSGKPTPSGPPGMPGMPGMPGGQPSEDPSRQAQPDPGVPPELAKLGISASDWEKIQASLTSDSGGAGAEGVPAEYRGLVKGYFKSISTK